MGRKKEEDDDFDLDDDEMCESLDEHMDEDEEETDLDDEALEDDPWEKQIKMNKNKKPGQHNVW